MEPKFLLKEGEFTYLEWPSLNDDYIKSKMIIFFVLLKVIGPYFLSLDDKGKIRVHYIKEKSEEIVSKEEFYRCGKFCPLEMKC